MQKHSSGYRRTHNVSCALHKNCKVNEECVQEIRDFIKNVLIAQPNTTEEVGAGSHSKIEKCLFIGGVPGTGKTACVTEVAQSLQQCCKTPAFRFVYVNALYLPTPGQFYSKLFESIKGACA